MSFKINQTVVHKSYGTGVIKSIETREFDAGKQAFYVIEIDDGGAPKKVFVPVESASDRLREPINPFHVKRIIELANTPCTTPSEHSTWNRRYREYMESIASGELDSIVTVYRELKALQIAKDLSFGERKLLEHARALIEKETGVELG